MRKYLSIIQAKWLKLSLARYNLGLILILGMVDCSEQDKNATFCEQDLKYITNPDVIGENSLKEISYYKTDLIYGDSENIIDLIVDTSSSKLVINEQEYFPGDLLAKTNKTISIKNGSNPSFGVLARDELTFGCLPNIRASFALDKSSSSQIGILGLADDAYIELPEQNQSFLSQVKKNSGLPDMFSLQLCRFDGPNKIILGGVDKRLAKTIGNFIPIIEKSSYVVPALLIRNAQNKKVIAEFPKYDPENKTGIKTILDSSTAFTILSPNAALGVVTQIIEKAQELGLDQAFPDGFFRTERGAIIKKARFSNLKQIRQFPSFEIGFLGVDGQKKFLVISPMNYFKEIDSVDPLIRIFGFRSSHGDIVLGQTFLENYFTFFDRENGQIGFGDLSIVCPKIKGQYETSIK